MQAGSAEVAFSLPLYNITGNDELGTLTALSPFLVAQEVNQRCTKSLGQVSKEGERPGEQQGRGLQSQAGRQAADRLCHCLQRHDPGLQCGSGINWDHTLTAGMWQCKVFSPSCLRALLEQQRQRKVNCNSVSPAIKHLVDSCPHWKCNSVQKRN